MMDKVNSNLSTAGPQAQDAETPKTERNGKAGSAKKAESKKGSTNDADDADFSAELSQAGVAAALQVPAATAASPLRPGKSDGMTATEKNPLGGTPGGAIELNKAEAAVNKEARDPTGISLHFRLGQSFAVRQSHPSSGRTASRFVECGE